MEDTMEHGIISTQHIFIHTFIQYTYRGIHSERRGKIILLVWFVVLFGWLSNITSGFFVGTFEVGDGLLSLVKSMHAKLTRQHQSEFLKGFILCIH
jgi:hypothetical protein